jgi:ParB family transcriptional regulator, chromosome partitioning protein
MDRKVLGRGLDALIPQDTTPKEKVATLRLELIKASDFQPRQEFDNDRIHDLANSIREKGVIQPVLVRPRVGGYYELIAGERRFRAARLLGMEEIPAIVRHASDAEVLEISIIENVQREGLNAVEEARAYRRLAQEFGHTQDIIADKVGKDKSSVSNILRILNLPEEIQVFLSKNVISLGHAKALLAFPDHKTQLDFCKAIIEKGWSVRQAENASKPKKRAAKRNAISGDADIRDVENRLREALGTKVRVHHSKKRGKIEIEYYSLDDLDRLITRLTRP